MPPLRRHARKLKIAAALSVAIAGAEAAKQYLPELRGVLSPRLYFTASIVASAGFAGLRLYAAWSAANTDGDAASEAAEAPTEPSEGAQ